MPRRDETPRDLLFGLLAFQNGMINQSHLVDALGAWAESPGRAMADLLVERGALTAPRRTLLDALLAEHLAAHDGDAGRSLAALELKRSTRESFAAAGGPVVEETLAYVGSTVDLAGEPDRETADPVGRADGDGPRFRALRPHARGGLGVVYVAIDAELNREVALKRILDQHADDPISRLRFLLEAEITGGLEHPGIVPVYGLGTYADGRPYYAMRFIKGETLRKAIEQYHDAPEDRSGLDLRRLLRRFLDVCNAIEYAHSRGVIHRDIKPGNVILGKHGETLVVDWGLAKPIGRVEPGRESGERPLVPPSASGSAETMPGSVLGTPAYMSPEQAAGEVQGLGPRSDVYSLGATLYCLLTGQPPFQGETAEVLEMVRRGEFAPPRAIDSTIDRALEAVCLKAMATRPEGRYPSSRALAEDIERWAADEPVSAWREPWTRTLTRWLARHRTGVTGVAAAMLAGIIGLSAVLVVQTRAKAALGKVNNQLSASLARETEANRALTAANDELSRSKADVQARYDLAVAAIKTFHTGVSRDFLLGQAEFKDLRDRLLRSAADFYARLGGLLGRETDPSARRALLRANFEMAELTGLVGRDEDALAAHRAILVARRALAAEPGADPAAIVDWGLSQTRVAALLEHAGRTSEALAAYGEAESTLAGLAAGSPEARAALADCRSRRGGLLSRTGRDAEALAAYRLARADQEAMAAAPGASGQSREDLASTIDRIGLLLQRTGHTAEAEAELRRALGIRERRADESPDDVEARSLASESHFTLGGLLADTGRPAEGEAEFRRALAIQKELADANPAVIAFRVRLADSHNNLAIRLFRRGRTADAEAALRSALEIRKELADEHPTVADYRNRLAAGHNNLGNIFWMTGRSSEAEVEFRRAIEIQQALADGHPTVTDYRRLLASSHNNLAALLSLVGRSSESEAEYRRAIGLFRALADANPAVASFRSTLATCQVNLGMLLSETGRPAEAGAEFRRAIQALDELVRRNPTVIDYRERLANSHEILGNLLLGAHALTEAEAEYRRSVVIAQALADADPSNAEFRFRLMVAHDGLGDTLQVEGRPADAEAEHRAAVAIGRAAVEANPRATDYRNSLAGAFSGLGGASRSLGRPAEARDACERAVEIREALVREVPDSPKYRTGLLESLYQRSLVRRDAGDPAGAAGDLRRAAAASESIPSRRAEVWFLSACCHAALAGLAGPEIPAAEAASHAETAMAMLHRAAAMGYRHLEFYRAQRELDPLRGRADFRLLLMDLAMPDDPFGPDR